MSNPDPQKPIAIGWIPNILGTLAYNILNKKGTDIELADYIIHHACSPSEDSKGRDEQVIYTAICDINDNPIKDDFSRYIRLVIYGEKNHDTKAFEGYIWEIKLVFSEKDHTVNDQLEGVISEYHINLFKKLSDIANTKSKSTRYPCPTTKSFMTNIKNVILPESKEGEGDIPSQTFIAEGAKFTLQRDGLFYIYPIERYLVKDGYHKNSERYKDKVEQKLAEEYSIRIKQLFHSHHHHRDTDDFLSCVKYSDNLEDSLQKMIRNLKYSISQERRMFLAHGFTEKDASNLIGVAAYGKTFTTICEQNIITANKNMSSVPSISHHADFFDNLETSVKAHKMANPNFMFNLLGRPPLSLFTTARFLTLLFPFLIFSWVSLNLLEYFGIKIIETTQEDPFIIKDIILSHPLWFFIAFLCLLRVNRTVQIINTTSVRFC